ncbi:hypothetical protein E2C01_055167 [Portunus trituberculatus]|uniref:Uncharacterized protein n=1 Tax=Portunus trituberculatus TaxID=210409 RepID=A0A5B7GWX3_PORTR|nr:hypothetical protein [Portunus trituberculatus]
MNESFKTVFTEEEKFAEPNRTLHCQALQELCIILSLNVTITTLLRKSSTEEQDEGMLDGIHFPLNDRNDIPSLESKLLDPSKENKVVESVHKYLDYKHSTAASVEIIMKEWFCTQQQQQLQQQQQQQQQMRVI